jgi:uncharacterized protein with HEPN domain
MPLRDDIVYVMDMLDAIAAIGEFTAGLDAAAFLADRQTQSAVIRPLEVLGEAARRNQPG